MFRLRLTRREASITLELMSPRQHLTLVLLAVVGVLTGHTLVYEGIGTALGERHDYLAPTAQLIVPLAIAGLAALAWRAAAASDLHSVDVGWRQLAGLQIALFLGQEATELALAESAAAADLRTIALGVVLQLPIAAITRWALRRGAEVVERLIVAAPLVAPTSRPVPLPALVAPVRAGARIVRRQRGPPHRR